MAATDPCSLLPGDRIEKTCRGVGKVVTDPVGVAGDAVSAGVADVIEKMGDAFGKAAREFLLWSWKQLDAGTGIDMHTLSLREVLVITVTLGFVIAFGMWLIEVALDAVAGSVEGMGRSLFGVFAASLATPVAYGVTDRLLRGTDALSTGILEAGLSGNALDDTGETIFGSLMMQGPFAAANAGIGSILLGLLFMTATAIMYLALVLRDALIILAIVVAPIALMGVVSKRFGTKWAKKWITGMLGLIFAKPLMMLVMATGLLSLERGLENVGEKNGTMLAPALVMLTLAGLAPFASIKLFGWLADEVHEAVGAAQMAGSAGNPVTRTAGAVQTAATLSRPFGGGARGGGGSGVGAGGPTPPPAVAPPSADPSATGASPRTGGKAGETGAAGMGAGGAGPSQSPAAGGAGPSQSPAAGGAGPSQSPAAGGGGPSMPQPGAAGTGGVGGTGPAPTVPAQTSAPRPAGGAPAPGPVAQPVAPPRQPASAPAPGGSTPTPPSGGSNLPPSPAPTR